MGSDAPELNAVLDSGIRIPPEIAGIIGQGLSFIPLALVLAFFAASLHYSRMQWDEKYQQRHAERKARRLVAKVRKETGAKRQVEAAAGAQEIAAAKQPDLPPYAMFAVMSFVCLLTQELPLWYSAKVDDEPASGHIIRYFSDDRAWYITRLDLYVIWGLRAGAALLFLAACVAAILDKSEDPNA